MKVDRKLYSFAGNQSRIIMNTSDFLQGQIDCKAGELAPAHKSDDYYRGYEAQYQHQLNMTELELN